MASELAIYYTPMHFMWGVKSGATPVSGKQQPAFPLGVGFGTEPSISEVVMSVSPLC